MWVSMLSRATASAGKAKNRDELTAAHPNRIRESAVDMCFHVAGPPFLRVNEAAMIGQFVTHANY